MVKTEISIYRFSRPSVPISHLSYHHPYPIYCSSQKPRCVNARLSPTLCNPMDHSPPGSSVYGILQARILKWRAMPSSGDRLDPGIKPWFPALQADSLPLEPAEKPFGLSTKKISKTCRLTNSRTDLISATGSPARS